MPLLSLVHLDDLLRVDGQPFVGVDHHTEQSRVGLWTEGRAGGGRGEGRRGQRGGGRGEGGGGRGEGGGGRGEGKIENHNPGLHTLLKLCTESVAHYTHVTMQ